MDVLASFVFQVMFYRYSVCGASSGETVRLVKQPYNRQDANCINVVLEWARSSRKVSHVAAEVAVCVHLSPLLHDAPLEASG